jgi:hypothetical protein
MEEFRPIQNYEGLYEISNIGRVKNLNNNKILKNNLNKTTGYYRVALRKNGKQTNKDIHHLIAETFITNLENKPIVDHIDQNTGNNNIDNLRWATRSENGMNSDIQSNNKTGYTGIFRTKYNSWIANLRKDGKLYSKSFKTIEKAIEYRSELEQKYFGIYSANYKI